MGGIEFGDRGVDVFEVEPHLEHDSTVFVDSDQLGEISSWGAPGLSSAVPTSQTDQSQTFASGSDELVTVLHHARLEVAPHVERPLARRQFDFREADDLPTTFDADLWR